VLHQYLQFATISHEAVSAESELEQFSLEMKSVVQVTLHTASSAKSDVRGNVVKRAQKRYSFSSQSDTCLGQRTQGKSDCCCYILPRMFTLILQDDTDDFHCTK